MIQLFINKQEVVFDGEKLKLTIENPYYSESSAETNEIQCPLLGCAQNLEVFKHINRQGVVIEELAYDCQLWHNNKLLVNGTATITDVTDEYVRVQVLGGNSESNFKTKLDELYIDDMHLGYCYHVGSDDRIRETYGDDPYIEFISSLGINTLADYQRCYYGAPGTVTAVYYRMYNETADYFYNNIFRHVGNYAPYYVYRQKELNHDTYPDEYRSAEIAQPYLHVIIKRVIENIGYKLVDSCYDKSPLNRLFVANVGNTNDWSSYMPHWSVNEFFTQIEQLAACVVCIDHVSREVKIIPRNEYFRQNNQYLEDVTNTFSTNIDADERDDYSNANIGYSSDDFNTFDRIPDEIYDYVQKIQKDSLDNLGSLEQYNSCVILHNGLMYMVRFDEHEDPYITPCNHFKNLIRAEGESLDMELKICPVKMEEMTYPIFKWGERQVSGGTQYYSIKVEDQSLPIIVTAGTERSARAEVTSIASDWTLEDMIEGGSVPDTADTLDILKVAIHDFNASVLTASIDGASTDILIHNPYTRNVDPQNPRGFSLSLLPDDPSPNIANTFWLPSDDVATTQEVKLHFTCRDLLDSTRPFMVANSKFACQKIEYSLSNSPIIEADGYFYPISPG